MILPSVVLRLEEGWQQNVSFRRHCNPHRGPGWVIRDACLGHDANNQTTTHEYEKNISLLACAFWSVGWG
jgi:hypothetical protein